MKQNVLILLAFIATSVYSYVDEEHTIPKRENRQFPEWSADDNKYHEIYVDLDYTMEEFWIERLWEQNGVI